MSLFADAFQPTIVRDLFSLGGRPSIRHLSDTITNAPKSGYDLDADAAINEVRVDFRETAFITEAVAGDAGRFASACFSSMVGIASAIENPETMGWALIRLYYAAFYGGHSLLRLLGRSCTYFDHRQTGRIRAVFAATGSPLAFDLPSGLYSCTLNPGRTGFGMMQTRGRVGGAHETFWELFDKLLSEFSEDALSGHMRLRDAQDVFAKMQAVRRIYRRGAGAIWLSAVRNEIQYRQGLGVWVPLTVNRSRRASLSRLADQWMRDPMSIDVDALSSGELPEFILACAFTTSLCRDVMSRVSERSSVASRSFARISLQLCA